MGFNLGNIFFSINLFFSFLFFSFLIFLIKLPATTINQTLPKIKNKSQINQTKNKLPKVYNSPLSSSINILYKSLFPDEKNSLDNFLENFPNKFIKKPKWEFSTSKTRGDDIIRKELMKKTIETLLL